MAKRRGGSFRPRRVQHDQIWVPVVFNNQVITDGSALQVTIVSGSDWADSGTGLERATLMTIRGWISVSQTPVVNVEAAWYAAIAITHEDAQLPIISSASAYIEDILWTSGGSGRTTASTADIHYQGSYREVNMQARRRITDQQIVTMDFASIRAGGIVAGVLRAFIRRN